MFEKIRNISAKLLSVLGLARDYVSMQAALARCQQRNLQINTIIDIGASDGRWSLMARNFFPNSSCFLIEAQSSHEDCLKKIRASNSGIEYIISAAVATVDYLVKERNLKPPFLLKLDTHGFELPIFEGARETLKNTVLIVVEAYNFKLTSESLRFHEMCSYMETLGFRCIDMCDPMHRPTDKVFWQMDLLFTPADRAEFLSNSYE